MSNTSKSGSTKYQTRLSPEDAEAVEQLREKEDLNKSEAVRELIRAGSVERERVEEFREEEGLSRRDAVQALVRDGLEADDFGVRELGQVFAVAGALGAVALFFATVLMAVLVVLNLAATPLPMYTAIAALAAALVAGVGRVLRSSDLADRIDTRLGVPR